MLMANKRACKEVFSHLPPTILHRMVTLSIKDEGKTVKIQKISLCGLSIKNPMEYF